MLRSFYFTLAASTIVCAIVLFAQAVSNSRINDRIESESRAVAGLRTQSLSNKTIRTLDDPGNESALTEESVHLHISEDRVKETSETIKRMVADIENVNHSPAEIFKVLPDILRIVQDLSLEELMSVVERFDVPTNQQGHQQGQSSESGIRMILSILIADQDPLLVVNNDELMKDPEISRSALRSLSRRDPHAALEWIDSAASTGVQVDRLRRAILSETLTSDVKAGVELLYQIKEAGDHKFQPVLIPSENLEPLGAALEDPKYQSLRPELTEIILFSTIVDSGISGVRETIEEMHLEKSLVANSIARVLDQSNMMRSEPEEALAWLTEVQSPEELEQSIPSVLSTWSMSDYNAAGEWLGKMEPSSIKDAAISSFALTVVRLDPEAATIWSSQIQNEEKRLPAIRESITAWRERDTESANEWLVQEGFDPEDFED